jgi:hypothetical protein
MSTFFELETFPQLVESRQQYLRSLAHPAGSVGDDSLRQRVGHTLVRLGRWVEGHRPDDAATILPSLQAASPRLAGGAK